MEVGDGQAEKPEWNAFTRTPPRLAIRSITRPETYLFRYSLTTTTGTIQKESDYYPYGGERVYVSGVPNQNYKFTGKERDSESGLDNFGARFDSSNLGRFIREGQSPEK